MREATIELNFRDAIKRALQEEMREDRSVVMIGEDIGHAGGPFKVTEGLIEEFGEEPISATTPARSDLFVVDDMKLLVDKVRKRRFHRLVYRTIFCTGRG